VPERIFLKLGGSLLTDKARPRALRADVLFRLASEISEVLSVRPGLQLLIGQGGGSFAHSVAAEYGTREGVRSLQDWRGYAATARAAAELNRIVAATLADAGIPVLPVQPSASASCIDAELCELDDRPLRAALEQGIVPLVYGDVALDEVRGGTILSTEQIFRWLAPRLRPVRILLVGEVDGVLTVDPSGGREGGKVVPEITPASLSELSGVLGGARGMDVTGGMMSKVSEMIALMQATPSLIAVQIVSGLVPDLVRTCLADGDVAAGTRILRNPT
jgi:isopentenyl phosphate kinase